MSTVPSPNPQDEGAPVYTASEISLLGSYATIQAVRATIPRQGDTDYTAEIWALYEDAARALLAEDAETVTELIDRLAVIGPLHNDAVLLRGRS